MHTLNQERSIDILVCGYLCVDLNPVFEGRNHIEDAGFENYFKPGSLTELQGMSFTIGGIVGNTGLILHKNGKKAHLVGLIGNDHLGELILNQFDKHHVSHSLTVIQEVGTSFGIVLAPPGVDRMFLEFAGCSRQFHLDHIDLVQIKQSKLLHFGYLPLLNNFFNDGGSLMAELLRKAQTEGTVTSMDLCLPDNEGQGKNVDWHLVLKQVLPYIDIITPSIEEILYMLKPELYMELSFRFGDQMIDHISYETIQDIGQQLIGLGAKIVLIKLAYRGVYLLTGDVHSKEDQTILNLDSQQWNHQECLQQAYPVDLSKMKNASGAGDTSVAAFLTALLDHETPKQSLMLCAMAGKESLYCDDLYTELPKWETIKSKINMEPRGCLTNEFTN